MMTEEQVPTLPIRKEDPPHVCFEKGRGLGVAQVEIIIEKMIQKPYCMVGGNPKSNHIFREGRKQALEELKEQIAEVKV